MNIDLLYKSIEVLVLENNLLYYKKLYINKTLLNKLKRRKRGKPIGLLGAEKPKYGQFWSPTKIAIRREEIETEKQY